MKPAIEVNNISKSYQISHQAKSYKTIKDDLFNSLKKPFGRSSEEKSETFWALDDVSFEVNPGEIFGVVGLNGSGKSTLLKILSRIVDPTKGRVSLRGRTASLLEVGTGFHPELTGRENIYLNGSMLGMSRREINNKFNEIVEFSEVEKFIDTPVKHYSSGMYVRLAFSVAAHLESEILILDEVLAVGDAAFQQKSMKKILRTMEEGRTVLFVSHSMSAVQQLCSRGILLDKGKVSKIGDVADITNHYLKITSGGQNINSHASSLWKNDGSYVNEYFVPSRVFIADRYGNRTGSCKHTEDYYLVVEGRQNITDPLFNIGFSLKEVETNNTIFLSMSTDGEKKHWPKIREGKITYKAKLPKHLLNTNTYTISLAMSLHNKKWLIDPNANQITIKYSLSGKVSESDFWKNPRDGILAPVIEWSVE